MGFRACQEQVKQQNVLKFRWQIFGTVSKQIYVHFLAESSFKQKLEWWTWGEICDQQKQNIFLFFYQRQLNSRCCQHHSEVPISLRVALRKVMSLNPWGLNGFCTEKSTPRCAVRAGVWCNLLCYQIRQRGKTDHKEISYFMRASWSHRSCSSCACALSSWNLLNMFAATGCCLKLSVGESNTFTSAWLIYRNGTHQYRYSLQIRLNADTDFTFLWRTSCYWKKY